MKETFGQRFLRLRRESKLTQDEIAQKLNVTAQAVSKWENDASLPDVTLLSDIADIFNISVDELLGKERKQAVLLDEDKRKNINSMLLCIRVLSSDGDKVKINLPMSIIIACVKLGKTIPDLKVGVDLNTIDFKEIISLVEQGVVGKLVEISSTDGDIVEIYVE